MKKIFLVLVAASMVFMFVGSASADLNDGLVAYWPFNGNANDESGNGYDGTVIGATLTTDRFGNAGSAYDFDGNDYIKADATGLPTGERTTTLWFYANTLSTRPVLLGYGGTGYPGTSWWMNLNHGGTLAYFLGFHYIQSRYLKYYYTQQPIGKWIHFATTTDSNGSKIYVNGVEVASNDSFVNNTYVTGKDLAIGVDVSGHGIAPYTDRNVGYFRGKIDDVYIYNRALSKAEIQELYRKGNKNPMAEIIGTWSSGIWYRDVAKSKWTKMWSGVPSGDIAAGDFTGDGKADVASCWPGYGLYYQNGANLGWTKVLSTAPDRVAAGDITGDGRDEIIGCGGDWGNNGIYYKDFAKGTWHHPWAGTPTGAIAAGDVTGDGKTDMVSCWSSGLFYQNGATLAWTKVLSTAPYKVTCGDVTGDGRDDIIGTWSSGIFYRNVATSSWTKMYSSVPSGEIAAGDFTGDGRADVASCWGSGLYYQNGATLGWTKVSNTAPSKLTAGDVTGD